MFTGGHEYSFRNEPLQTLGKRGAQCFQRKEEGIKSTDAREDLKELQECMDKMGGFATGTGGLVLARTKSSPVRDVLRIGTQESRLLWRLYFKRRFQVFGFCSQTGMRRNQTVVLCWMRKETCLLLTCSVSCYMISPTKWALIDQSDPSYC